jgi:hypothetical protein
MAGIRGNITGFSSGELRQKGISSGSTMITSLQGVGPVDRQIPGIIAAVLFCINI